MFVPRGCHGRHADPPCDAAIVQRMATTAHAPLPAGSSRVVRALAALSWLVVLPLAVVALARVIAHDASFPLIAINAFTTWIYLPAWGVAALAIGTRRRALAIVSCMLVTLHVAWVAPGALRASALPAQAETAPALRVMTANLLAPNRQTDATVHEILEARPDVLVVEELTPEWLDALAAGGVTDALPFGYVVPRADCFGIGILSRKPITHYEAVDLDGVPLLRATVDVEGHPVTVLAAHTLPPRTEEYARVWDHQMAVLSAMVERERGAVILLGDLNATTQARNYERLVAGRLRGAHEDRGRGLATTWPNGLFPLPPIRLDHVLVSRELAVRDVRELAPNGSDHVPVVADLAILAAPARARGVRLSMAP